MPTTRMYCTVIVNRENQEKNAGGRRRRRKSKWRGREGEREGRLLCENEREGENPDQIISTATRLLIL